MLSMANDYYASAALARGFDLSTFIQTAMDEYIAHHPVPASVPLEKVLSLCNIDESELRNTEGIELE